MILSYAGVGLYIASTFVEGGASFVVRALLGYVQPVIRLLLVVGLIKMFLSLGPPIPSHNQPVANT